MSDATSSLPCGTATYADGTTRPMHVYEGFDKMFCRCGKAWRVITCGPGWVPEHIQRRNENDR